ncbi:hypothetical protein SMC26_40315 [Actinomadura fulvescens]|uniref:Head-to-tail stopper n=1 Tax=Actinomadura fulvescens TaxID=46160 RepID=A0ABN3Q982_9ACTN
MPIPVRLLPFTVAVVRPVVDVDRYGNPTYDYGPSAARTPVRAWLEPREASEPTSDGRAPLVADWLLITNHDDVHGRDRIEWGALTFEVDGPPAPIPTPAGPHHVEATLRHIQG